MGRGSGAQQHQAIQLRDRPAAGRPSWLSPPPRRSTGAGDPAIQQSVSDPTAQQIADRYAGWTPMAIASSLGGVEHVLDELRLHGQDAVLDDLADRAASALVVDLAEHSNRLRGLLDHVGSVRALPQLHAHHDARADAVRAVQALRDGDEEAGWEFRLVTSPGHRVTMNLAARDRFAEQCAADPAGAVEKLCGQGSAEQFRSSFLHRRLRPDRAWNEILTVDDFATAFDAWEAALMPVTSSTGPRREPLLVLAGAVGRAARRNAGADRGR